MWTLTEEFSGIEIGQSASFRNLTLFPLIRRIPHVVKLDYLLLEDALAKRASCVTELHESGSVPELRFENASELPVLLLDGEELIGAKQNRVLNLTILAPPKQTIVIPVSCVEAGRWSRATTDFSPVDHVMYSRVRAERVSQVTQSMRSSGSRRSNQSVVWNDIAAKAASLNATSPTQSMSAIYERHASALGEFVRAFRYQEGQDGVAFAIGGRVLGLDLFDHGQVMQRFFSKLVRSFALDALDAPSKTTEPATQGVLCDFFGRLASVQSFANPAVGIGKDVRFSSPELFGAALWAQERYVHINAFARFGRDDAGLFQTRISRRIRTG
jgi:hypothetical protein